MFSKNSSITSLNNHLKDMKLDRQKVFEKCNGLCAYTWKPLWEDWQVDHVFPKYLHYLWSVEWDVNHIDNLLPAIRIINHYKRWRTLEEFREYMLSFHTRLSKLPKKTNREQTVLRIKYINTVADLFWIDVKTPFSWKFHFEKSISN